MNKRPFGLYIHVPFCLEKCAYCDFYSAVCSEQQLNDYTARLIKEIKLWGDRTDRPIDTVYFGGGTPSLLKHRLPELLDTVRNSFHLYKDAEITLEMNPAADIEEVLDAAAEAGVNRLSIGVQSGNDGELKNLGRAHSAKEAEKAFRQARRKGFCNISVDLMLGLPDSDKARLQESLKFICGLEPEHISAYILKIEPETAFYRNRDKLNLPDEDQQAEQYLAVCEYLKNAGYEHYEISNFCRDGKRSRHNLKYWMCEEYLGLGPSAHSFLDGRRFFYPRDLKEFMQGGAPVFDGEGGGSDEFVMLSLRLKEGLVFADYRERFGKEISAPVKSNCDSLKKAGLAVIDDEGIRLTEEGMLISNSIINEIIECIN